LKFDLLPSEVVAESIELASFVLFSMLVFKRVLLNALSDLLRILLEHAAHDSSHSSAFAYATLGGVLDRHKNPKVTSPLKSDVRDPNT
jgi:hypothetical protein